MRIGRFEIALLVSVYRAREEDAAWSNDYHLGFEWRFGRSQYPPKSVAVGPPLWRSFWIGPVEFRWNQARRRELTDPPPYHINCRCVLYGKFKEGDKDEATT